MVWNWLTGVCASVHGLAVWSRLHARELQKWDQIFWPVDLLQEVVQVANGVWVLSGNRREDSWSEHFVPVPAMDVNFW
jgi:hypothetical protein